ncbi:MAG: coiled-coil domain-containing protein [Bacteroidota bacterium]
MDFATLHLDTYKVVKLLQEKGYSKKEAEGFIEAIQEITLSGVATKQDISDVRKEIQIVQSELKEDISDVRKEIQIIRSELKTDIADVRQEIQDVRLELKGDIANLKNETLKFLMVQTVAIVGVMVALFQFFLAS